MIYGIIYHSNRVMDKIGIMTFHHSYNCGSMMQAFALQTVVNKIGLEAEIINFSNEGQKKLYKTFYEGNSIKNIVKNLLIFPHKKKIEKNNEYYISFMNRNMHLSKKSYSCIEELDDVGYSGVIAGSDQIWNITIKDSDNAYFLPWVKSAKKIAYAPSFGAKNILQHSNDSSVYAHYLHDFTKLSIRENNGKKWIKDLIDVDVPVVLDPTLLLDANEYKPLIGDINNLPEKYIFYYSPQYDNKINILVSQISKNLNLPVIAFNSKGFYVKRMSKFGFMLPEKEDPSIYLALIKNAELVITTSFHGSVFSSIFRKKFWIVENGGMLETDDRVYTMTDMLDLSDRIISINYEKSFNYNSEKDYATYETLLNINRIKSMEFLLGALLEKENNEK